MSCKIIKETKYADRPSPPYHANECQNKIKTGNDGKAYVSRPDKNGLFHWMKIKTGKTPEEYYEQFPDSKPKKYIFPEKTLERVKNDLLKHDILMFHIGWKDVGNFIDYAWSDAEALAKKSKIGKRDDKVNMIFYAEHRRYFSEILGDLFLQHSILTKDKRLIVNEIFTKYFGKDFSWNGSKNKAMHIKLKLIKR